MFERFSAQARDVVRSAVETAEARRASDVGCEHLLIGLAAGGEPTLAAAGITAESLNRRLDEFDPDRLDSDALNAIGIDAQALADEVDRSFGAGTWARSAAAAGRRRGLRGLLLGEHRPFTPDAKKCLELGLREAIADSASKITTTHLLRGILRAPGDRVGDLLDRETIDRLREGGAAH